MRSNRIQATGMPALETPRAALDLCKCLLASSLADWDRLRQTFDARQADDVHAVRILLRRARTLLDLFGDILPQRYLRRWRSTLRALSHHYDLVRDLDALTRDRLPRLLHEGRSPEFAAVRRLLEARARNAHDDAARTLNTQTLDETLHRLAIETTRLRGTRQTRSSRSQKLVARRLRTLEARARKRLRKARAGQPPTLHRLRIALKRLRDTRTALQCTRPALADAPRKSLHAATDALGELQDLDRARGLLDQLLGDKPAVASAVTRLVRRIDARYRKLAPRALRRARKALRDA